MKFLRKLHWPEYFMEAAALGLFMISAGVAGVLLEDPLSSLHLKIPSALLRRAIMGTVMGLTAAGIIYSPFGKRSGAHMNPSVTLSFLYLRKISWLDASFYILFQFIGGILGVMFVWVCYGQSFSSPPVRFVATVPGDSGRLIAMIAEFGISSFLFLIILFFSNSSRLKNYTGLAAGILISFYITFEAPFSGMSMNPARTFASAVFISDWGDLWIYFLVPPIAMLCSAKFFLLLKKADGLVACPKLYHSQRHQCIFCDYYPELYL